MKTIISAVVLGLASTMAFADDSTTMSCAECCKTMCKSEMSCCNGGKGACKLDAKAGATPDTKVDRGTKPAVNARQSRDK